MIIGNTVGSPVPDLRKGMAMTGPINMNGQAITGLKTPEADTDAATKQYADSLHRLFTVALAAAGWSAAAPYTQTVTAAGILETDTPHFGPRYSADTDTALAEKEAFALVDDLETGENSLTFTCLEERPGADLNILLEVNR